MGASEKEALLRKGYGAMAAGDGETVVGMFSPEGILHVGGRGPFHGDHRGRDDIAATLGGLFRWTAGTLRMEVEEVFADDDHGIVVLRETATRAADGATLDVRETHLCRFEPGADLIRELWDIPRAPDREAHDDFFA